MTREREAGRWSSSAGLRPARLVAPVIAALLFVTTARADDARSPGTRTIETEQAREAFRQGAALARDAQWGAALAAFERSAKLRASAGTTYNIAVCERALGRYVRARSTFQRALDERKGEGDLPESSVADIQRFLGEIDGLVGAIDVTLAPADAAVAVDGQPLEPVAGAGAPTLLAGTRPTGPGEAPPAGRFRVIVDPGAHVFVVSREGFADAVKRITVRPGDKTKLDLTVARLPASLTISADRRDAVVTVNALDVGVAPVELSRPAGTYHVLVRRPGYIPYEVDAALEPGQKTELYARLPPEQKSLLGRWWFWTAAGVVLTGAAVTTYALTRPDPERPPVDGGSLGWAARAP
ncbi:MAG TPA: PEGA domain-containing protein [Gaiellaceae bacterium]|nr:PEGA domain-containing protein [Gaiellaceae bacterium]